MDPVYAFTGAAAAMVVAVVLIVLALVVYLVAVIVQLRKITSGLDRVIASVGEVIAKTAPVNDVVTTINQQLDAGVDLLEGLLVKKAGMGDAVGLVDGLYPGAAAAGFRNFPESASVKAPRIGEVYTNGTLTLARLGREAPIAAASPEGPVLRNVAAGSSAARQLYPDGRHSRPESLPRSPVIGAGAPVQYDPQQAVGGSRRRMPRRAGLEETPPPPSPPSPPGRPEPPRAPQSRPRSPDAGPQVSRWRRLRRKRG